LSNRWNKLGWQSEGEAMIQRATHTREFGPGDHGRRVSYDEFMSAHFQEGYDYEIIDGEIYVSPKPNPDHEDIESGLLFLLNDYVRQNPSIINKVSCNARVFVPGHKDVTVPEPDFAAYHNFPKKRARGGSLRWEEVSPILIAEVVSPDNPTKDLERNVALYWEVPSIKEYWVFDLRKVGKHPLTIRRRIARQWKIIPVDYGHTYTTRLLPGFELNLDALP
jgi:Uma2 family endonuclease